MQRFILAFVVFILAALFSPTASAQTVESVLRALQERKLVLLYRQNIQPLSATPSTKTLTEADLIQWTNNIDPFPEDNAIKELKAALVALNIASYEFDILKGEFIAYDVDNQVFVNLQCSGAAPNASPIVLPSVGQFDETNWKTKLRLLASNINQLRALTWSAYVLDTVVTGFKDFDSLADFQLAHEHGVSHPGNYIKKDSKGNNFPAYWETHPVKAIVPSFRFRWFIYSDREEDPENILDSGEHWESVNLYERVESQLGIKALAGLPEHCTVPDAWKKITGDIKLFKTPETPRVTDFVEGYIRSGSPPDPVEEVGRQKESPTARMTTLRFGTFTPCVFNLKNIYANPRVYESGNYDVDLPPAAIDLPAEYSHERVGAQFEMMGLPALSIVGNFAPAVVPLKHTAYSLILEGEAEHRTHAKLQPKPIVPPGETNEHHFGVSFCSVFVPEFTEFFPKALERLGNAPSRAGEVEIKEMDEGEIRVHVGRGDSDLNQIAWLRVRKDGFGSMIFNGSPNAFDLVYEEDLNEFEPPIGDRTFDTTDEFSDSEKTNSGWDSRSDYFSNWCLPRLRQVKGGDVLVDIKADTEYNHSYARVLKFYWADQATKENETDKFYKLVGSPFKTIKIRNSSVPSTGRMLPQPQERYHLLISEDSKRYHDITQVPGVVPQYAPTCTIKSGKTDLCTERTVTITKTKRTNLDDTKTNVVFVSGTDEGKNFSRTHEFDYGDLEVEKVSFQKSGITRTVEYTSPKTSAWEGSLAGACSER